MKIQSSLILISIIMMLGSCQTLPSKDVQAETDKKDSPIESEGEKLFAELKDGDFEIVVIEDCEYLVYRDDFTHGAKGFGFMAHKGNCKNSIHPYLDETVAVKSDKDNNL